MIRALPLSRTIPLRRVAVLAAAFVLAAAAALTALTPANAHPEPPAPSLAARLGPRTWAMAIPVAWLAAPMPDLRADDVVDLLGTHAGERAIASEVATGLRVMSMDEGTIVVELAVDDAAAIAEARARGLSLVPILRSSQ